jgi:hypothetical protein
MSQNLRKTQPPMASVSEVVAVAADWQDVQGFSIG